MPERKKPASSRRTGSPARSGLRKPPRRATSVERSRRTAEPRKKVQPRKPSLRRKPAEQAPDVEILADETVAEATLRAEERPVAIAGQTPATEVPPAAFGEAAYPGAPGLLSERTADETATPADTIERAERYPQDWLVAALSAALAATVFLPWYRFMQGDKAITLNGWQTGTWGPVVLFLALGSLAIAITRLANVRVALPLPHPTIHEGVGWIAIFAVLIKRLRAPVIPGSMKVGQTWWILVPIIVGLVLAFIAGRMTSGPPLVIIPGWHRGRAGAVGLALAVVVLVGGGAFGYLNSGRLENVITDKRDAALGGGGSTSGNPSTAFKPIIGKFPKCASAIPSPTDAKPETAVEQSAQTPCIWVMHSETKPDAILTFYRTALPKSGFTFTVAQANAAGSTLSFSGKKCGSISISNAQQGKKGSRIAVYLAPCPTAKASPRPTSS